MKLVTTKAYTAEIEAQLLAVAPDLDIVAVDLADWDAAAPHLREADIVEGSFGGGSGSIFGRVVANTPRVRWIHTSSAGVDEILCPQYYERDFLLTCGKGESVANLIAEHAMALLLSLTRSLVYCARLHAWHRAAFDGHPTELRGMTMGIVGFGAVGRDIAIKANAFGMNVLGIRREAADPPAGVEAVWGQDRLLELLSRSDVVVLVLPNTFETANTFGEAEWRAMKPSAFLVNVGRGQVMQREPMERALTEGWIAGAGLDVMPEEPWPADSVLWELDHVIITPHIAGNSPQRSGRNMRVFVENMRRFVAGEPLISLVYREYGY